MMKKVILFFLGLFTLWGCSSQLQVKLSGDSPPGSIYLYPRHEQSAQVPDRVDIEELPRGSKTQMENGIAVIFGIEEYKYTFEASYKRRDATTFSNYCRDVLGIPDERIALRLDSFATKAEFDFVFEPRGTNRKGWLKQRLQDRRAAAQTDLFIYLAGHGFPDLSTENLYFIPYDRRPNQAADGIALKKLFRTLSDFGARRVMVFIESSFSGVSGYDRSGVQKPLVQDMNPIFPAIQYSMIGPSTVVFTATSGKQSSNNRADLGYGIFTYFALKGLGGEADGDGDSAITVEELFRYVNREVPRKALEQPLEINQVPNLLPPVGQLGERAQWVLVQY